ncbi:uncharacterized protein [Bos mutus]|uniref:uncharacterized protein n=1 Tax=Bos mutus TaxID=72004 RepID=UPI0038B456BA
MMVTVVVTENPPRIDGKFRNTGSASAGTKRDASRTQRYGSAPGPEAASGPQPNRPAGGTADRARHCARLQLPAPRGRGTPVRRSRPSLGPRYLPAPKHRPTFPPGCRERRSGPQRQPPAPCTLSLTPPLRHRKVSGTASSGVDAAGSARAPLGFGGFGLHWLRSDGGGETQTKSWDSGSIPGAFECRAAASHPAQAVTFLSLCPEDFTPHPACSPNSDFEPKRVQEYLRPGHSQQALWPSPKQLQVGITVPGRGNPTEARSCFPKLYPGENFGGNMEKKKRKSSKIKNLN